MEVGGILGVLVLLAGVWAILNIFQSTSGPVDRAGTGAAAAGGHYLVFRRPAGKYVACF